LSWRKLTSFLAGCGVAAFVVAGPLAHRVAGDAASAGPPQGNANLIGLPFKFDGAGSCNNADCHGKAAADDYVPSAEGHPDTPGYNAWYTKNRPGSEYTIWKSKDAHKKAYAALKKPDVKKNPAWGNIAKNMGIAKAEEDVKCLNCHALSVPDAKQGQSYDVTEGVTCDSCHGPSEKWREPHAQKHADAEPSYVWALRAKYKSETPAGHEAMLKETGVYDTRPPISRAEKCVNCHLAIDADMVKAGHPQPSFEIDYYSALENRHWREEDGYFHTKLWASGQLVCVRDAMQQLAARATAGAPADAVKDAGEQAMSHYAMLSALLATKTVSGDAAGIEAHGKALKDALAGGKNPDIAKEAGALADAATALIATASTLSPGKDATVALLKAIAGQADLVKDLGFHGAEQQFYALYDLYGAYQVAEKVSDAAAKPVSDALAGDTSMYSALDFDAHSVKDAAAFSKSLDAVKSKLP
jgi:hypothetical protein